MQTIDNKRRKISKDKETAWLEKQKLPTGSSPVAWDSKYASSSDEEFEGFLQSDHLLLSGADKSTRRTAVVDFFQGFECNVVERTVEKDGKVTFAVKFPSAKSAVAALEKFKHIQLRDQTISLTRSVDPKYISYCVKGFKKNLHANDIRRQVEQKFSEFGKILHFFRPSEENDFGYLYMALKPEFIAKPVKVKGFQVRVCQMKGKVTKRLSSNWA